MHAPADTIPCLLQTYGNPVYSQNAMRAIEYAMGSGALTSASLYLLVTAYTPGDMDATTEMIRNLHAALKEFETKYEMSECSTRRMNFCSTKLINFMELTRQHRMRGGGDVGGPQLPGWTEMLCKLLR